jgi:hypothetical protein
LAALREAEARGEEWRRRALAGEEGTCVCVCVCVRVVFTYYYWWWCVCLCVWCFVFAVCYSCSLFGHPPASSTPTPCC